MRSAGQRDKLVTLQRATASRDDHNEETSTWKPIGQEYASVIFGRGDERRSAAQTQAAQAVTFQLLDNATTRTLSARDRILWNGTAWDLTAPGVPINRGELEFVGIGAVQ